MIKFFALPLLFSLTSAIAQTESWGDGREVMTVRAQPVVLEGSDVKFERIDGRSYIDAPKGRPARIRLAQITAPLLSQPLYALQGSMSYSDVGGEGYLEMWSDFGDKGRFFTRTLASYGPMAHIVGDSGLSVREFLLPFDEKEERLQPRKLELDLVLPQGGYFSVFMDMVRLVEYSPIQPTKSDVASARPAQFWTIGWCGVIFGGITWLLAFRAPRAARLLAWIGVSVGMALLVAGFIVPLFNQPIALGYSLLALGILITVVYAGLLWLVVRLRVKSELRRMVAMDLG